MKVIRCEPRQYNRAKVDFTVFGIFVDAARIRERLSVPALASRCHLPADDINRAIAGKVIGDHAFFALCDWLGKPSEFFTADELKTKREAFR